MKSIIVGPGAVEPKIRICPWQGPANVSCVLRFSAQRGIPDGEKRVYEYLARFSRGKDFCFPGQRRMARDLGKCERQVRYALAALLKRGLLAVRRGERRTNTYVFLDHPLFHQEEPTSGTSPATCENHGHHAARKPASQPAAEGTPRFSEEEIESARHELERNRRVTRNRMERPGALELPDRAITLAILGHFRHTNAFFLYLRDVVQRVDTSTIRSYGFYLEDLRRRSNGSGRTAE